MNDFAKTPLALGDFVIDNRDGSVWQVVQADKSIFEVGYRIGVKRVRPSNFSWDEPLQSGERMYLTVSRLIRVTVDELTSLMGCDKAAYLALWESKAVETRKAKHEELKARRSKIDRILVERGIRK